MQAVDSNLFTVPFFAITFNGNGHFYEFFIVFSKV